MHKNPFLPEITQISNRIVFIFNSCSGIWFITGMVLRDVKEKLLTFKATVEVTAQEVSWVFYVEIRFMLNSFLSAVPGKKTINNLMCFPLIENGAYYSILLTSRKLKVRWIAQVLIPVQWKFPKALAATDLPKLKS